MRAARDNLFRRRSRSSQWTRPQSIRVTTPAPISGWNTRDGTNELGPDECFLLDNMVPQVGGLVLRPGYKLYHEASTSELTALLVWASGTEEKLIYATSSALTETSGTTATGFTGGDWMGAMMNDRLGLVNGVDAPQTYDGSAFAAMSLSGAPSPNQFKGLKVFKSRSYFWGDALEFWYSQPNALGGVLTKFPLTTVAQKGGYVVSINAWTVDGGSGPDDFFVVTTSKGEVIVYSGSNPSDANDWALVGRYYISEPISKRGFLELDGKLYVLTKNDLELLPDRFARQTSPPSKIAKAIQESYAQYSQGPWGVYFDAKRKFIVVNVPQKQGVTHQYVLANRGACRWTRINTTGFVMFRGDFYFAGKGALGNYLLWDASTISVTQSGEWNLLRHTAQEYTTNYGIWRMDDTAADHTDFIFFEAKTGYSPLRSNGEKRIAMYRPLFSSPGWLVLNTALSFDYDQFWRGNYVSYQESQSESYWGAPWGVDWGQIQYNRGQWLVGHGTGQTVSLRLRGLTMVPVQWAQTDWEMIPGGKY